MTEERVTGAAPRSRPAPRPENGNGANGGAGKPGAVAARTLEAPHRRQESSALAHVANFGLLSFWRASSWVLRHVPAGPAYRIGSGIAMVGYALSPMRRRWLRCNFGHVLGVSPADPAAGKLARAAYRNYLRYVMELMRLPGMTAQQAESMIELDGLERFMEIYRKSNGVVVVSAHLGNNEAMAAGFVGYGLPVSVVGDDTAFNGLYELLNDQRRSWGVEVISWRNLRGVYGVLRRKECLGLLVDWGYRSDGIPVKFFDCWTTLPAGPALLASRHDSAIVPLRIQRLPDGHFRASVADPIHVPSSSPADLARATQQIATELERFIAPAPEQWYIFKPIWPPTDEEAAALEARHADMLAGRAGRNGAPGADGEAGPSGESAPER